MSIRGELLFAIYLGPEQGLSTDTRYRDSEVGQGARWFHTVMEGAQIHGVPASLWGPAADAGGRGCLHSWMGINF